MFSRKEFVRRYPYFASYDAEKPIRLDEARLDAWALALGQRRGDDRPESRQASRPHRGLLPDVDFSRAVPVQRQRGLIFRLIFRLFGPEEKAGASETGSGAVFEDHTTLGETRLKAYVRLIETEASGQRTAPSAPIAIRKHSRAA